MYGPIVNYDPGPTTRQIRYGNPVMPLDYFKIIEAEIEDLVQRGVTAEEIGEHYIVYQICPTARPKLITIEKFEALMNENNSPLPRDKSEYLGQLGP
jgi:hypothetical protein